MVNRLAKASGSLIHPSQKALGRAKVIMGVVTTCEACQNEWTKDPPFPESAEKGHGHVLKRGERCGQQAGLPKRVDH